VVIAQEAEAQNGRRSAKDGGICWSPKWNACKVATADSLVATSFRVARPQRFFYKTPKHTNARLAVV
jgi:hypothetical protein